MRAALRCPRRPQERNKVFLQRVSITNLALPDYQAVPTESLPLRILARVAVAVLVELGTPVARARRRHLGFPAGFVSVPKTAVDQHRLSTRSECKVRLTRKLAEMDAETISQAVQQPPNEEFGFGVLTLYPGHKGTAGSRGKRVGHGQGIACIRGMLRCGPV